MKEKLFVITSDSKPIMIVDDLNCPKINEKIEDIIKDVNKYYESSIFKYEEIKVDKKCHGENVLRVFFHTIQRTKIVFYYYELEVTR